MLYFVKWNNFNHFAFALSRLRVRSVFPLLMLGTLLGFNTSNVRAGSEETLSPMIAVPTSAITIDGDLADWDFTGSQTAYVAAEFLEQERGEFVFSYDKDALYVAARVADTTPLRNIHHAVERFWEGDSIELRLYTNLKNNQHIPTRTQKGLDRQVVHLTFFRQHTSGAVWKCLAYGADLSESKINPDGVVTAFREFADKTGYAFEAKIPWSVLNVPVPPQPGDSIRALLGFNFSNQAGDRRIRSAPGAYRVNPGDFGFLNTDAWGYLQFAGEPLNKRCWPDPSQLLAALKKPQEGQGIPLVFPRAAQVTVNIYEPKTGRLVRELVQDRILLPGAQTMIWDGKDNAGAEAPLGDYTYQALVHQEIKARYIGSTGSSGTPPYANDVGTGEWGGDHSSPLAVATDATGMTFLWPVAEQGRAIVRLDLQDRTLWRYTPFFDAAGNFYTLASDGEYIYLTYETPTTLPSVFRLSAATGEPRFFAKDAKSVPLPLAAGSNRVETLADSRPVPFDLIATGMAVDNQHLYVSLFSANEILVLNKTDASLQKRISIPGPRGLALVSDGVLLVASYAGATGRVCRVTMASGECRDLVTAGLSAPWGVAVHDNGNFLVTDLGSSQQIKEFAPDGKPVQVYGKSGGRPYAGTYRAGDYRNPAGIAADRNGGFVVVEAALPGVISRTDKGGRVAKQWFGPGAYSTAVWPDPVDPFLIYSLPGSEDGIIRSVLDPKSGAWRLDAYWAISSSYTVKNGHTDLSVHTFADPAFHRLMDNIPYPQTVRLGDASYMSSDSARHPIVRIAGDQLVPVAAGEARERRLWIGQDADGNGHLEGAEWEAAPGGELPVVIPRKPGMLNGHVGSHTLSAYSGNWYLAADKTIYRIPCASFAGGKLRFNVAGTKVFVADVTEGFAGSFWSTYRTGILGMREDTAGNLFVLYTYGGKSPGIGHSSDITRVFLVKFDPQGKRLWSAGRKAASFAKPGEIYNPWVLAGLLGDQAVAISDEAGGMIHFYSTDGFYLGRIFADVARGDGRPGQYLFNGENFSGRVQEFPGQKDYRYMAYMGQTDSRVFALEGVDTPRQTLAGKVTLSQHYGVRNVAAEMANLTRVARAPTMDGSMIGWEQTVPLAIQGGDKELASVRLTLSGEALWFRFEVKDGSPLVNAEPDPKIAFKGGDAVDLYFGPSGERKEPVEGDVRLLIGLHNGKATLVGMKPKSKDLKRVQAYSNPAGYTHSFDFIGPVEGAEVSAVKTADGYTVVGRVPLAFLRPLSFAPGTELRFDADVLGSDPSGQKTVTRTFWHSAGDSALTMTQDLPTEAWLYPCYWGRAMVK